MDGIQLEKLYVAIEAQTDQFNSQMAGVNSKIDGMSSTVNKATKKASGSFGNIGKAIFAAFSIRALIGFFNKFLEITKQTETFKKTLATAFTPLITTLQPVMNGIIMMVARVVAFVTGLIQGLFPSLAKGSADSSKAIIADNNKVKQSYAGFDELTTVSDNSASFSATAAVPEVTSMISAEEVNKLVAAGKAFAVVAKWIAAIAAVAGTLYILNTVWGWIPAVIAGFKALFFAWGGFWSFMYESTGIIGTVFQGLSSIFYEAFSALAPGPDYLFGLEIASTAANAALLTMIGIVAIVVAAISALIQLWTEASDRGETFRANIMGVVDGLIDTFNKFWAQVEPIWIMFVDMLVFVWDNGIKPLWDGFVNFVAAIVNLIAEILLALKPLIDFIISVFGPAFQVVAQIVIVAFGFIFAAIGQIVGWILDILAVLINWFGGAFVTGIKMAVAFIISFFNNWYNTVKEVIGNIQKVFTGITDFISGVFSGDWNKAIKGLSSAFDGVVGAVTAPFKLAFNAIADMWNKTLGGFKVDFLGFKFTVPTMQKWTSGIPQLARGGSLDAGSLFVAGESGAEMMGSYNGKTTVMPLENTSFVAAMESAMVRGLTTAMGNQSNVGPILIQVDGMTLAKSVETNLNKLSTVQGGLKIAL